MAFLIILRGLPGSGKSTLAHILSENGKYPVLSVDDFFLSPLGDYQFDYSKNHLAYKDCEERARLHMGYRTEKILLDNTFTMEWEMEPYFKLASEFKYTVFVATVENRHKGTNIHGVTDEQLKKMAEKYEVVLM